MCVCACGVCVYLWYVYVACSFKLLSLLWDQLHSLPVPSFLESEDKNTHTQFVPLQFAFLAQLLGADISNLEKPALNNLLSPSLHLPYLASVIHPWPPTCTGGHRPQFSPTPRSHMVAVFFSLKSTAATPLSFLVSAFSSWDPEVPLVPSA